MSLPSADDGGLIQALLDGGDSELFDRLVERHWHAVLRTVLSVLPQSLSSEAEDVAQAVFLRAFDRLELLRGGNHLRPWLCRMAVNLAINHRTSARRRRAREARAVDDGSRTAGKETVADRLDQSDRADRVRACLARLPEPYRSILRLHYWLDRSVGEISADLGLRPGTVKSYLHRGRARLHTLLTEGDPTP